MQVVLLGLISEVLMILNVINNGYGVFVLREALGSLACSDASEDAAFEECDDRTPQSQLDRRCHCCGTRHRSSILHHLLLRQAL